METISLPTPVKSFERVHHLPQYLQMGASPAPVPQYWCLTCTSASLLGASPAQVLIKWMRHLRQCLQIRCLTCASASKLGASPAPMPQYWVPHLRQCLNSGFLTCSRASILDASPVQVPRMGCFPFPISSKWAALLPPNTFILILFFSYL